MDFTVCLKSYSSCKWWRCCFVLLFSSFTSWRKSLSRPRKLIWKLFLCQVQGIPVLYNSRRALTGDTNNTFALRPAIVMNTSSSVSLESRGTEPWCVHGRVSYNLSAAQYQHPEHYCASPCFHLLAPTMSEKSLSCPFLQFQMKQNRIFQFFILARKKISFFFPLLMQTHSFSLLFPHETEIFSSSQSID